MSELRKDPIVGRWVVIAQERAKRPDDFGVTHEEFVEGPCPFCQGNEAQTPPEIFAIRDPKTAADSPGWSVRVIPSIKPLLRIEGELERRGKGLYDLMNGIGAHEVIVETPQHIANSADLSEAQLAGVFSAYINRLIDLNNDPRLKYVLIFKNYGRRAGSGRIRHARSQLIATPVNPKLVKEELTGSKRYFDYRERCIFCDMIKQELYSERLIEDIDGFIAFAPFASRFPFETWILPKTHSCDFSMLAKEELGALAKIMKRVLTKLKALLNDPPYNYVLHTAPFRTPKAGYWKTLAQDYHWHIEIIPRLTNVAGFEWGAGVYINIAKPEDAAKYLREAKTT